MLLPTSIQRTPWTKYEILRVSFFRSPFNTTILYTLPGTTVLVHCVRFSRLDINRERMYVCIYVCMSMHSQYFQQSTDTCKPGMVANNPARGQLNRETVFSPVPVRASEFGLAKRVRPSRPASARSFSTLGLNLVLNILTGFLSFSATASTSTYRQPPSGQSRVNRVTQLRIDRVHCRESASTGPVVLRVVPVMGAVFSGVAMEQFVVRLSFPTTTIGM